MDPTHPHVGAGLGLTGRLSDDPKAARGDDLDPILDRYKVVDQDTDAQIAHRSIREKLFGTKEKKTRIGKYALEQMIGVGGMGRVYLATDTELDRRVAIKLLKGAHWTGAGQEQGRLWREARTLAQISHRNVVSVYEVGENPELGVYIVMDFVEGMTMRRWIEDSDPSPRQIYRVLMSAGSGLFAAHRAGIVHRDFKPDNVLIGNDGRVCVVDFGIAHDIAMGGLPHVAPTDFKTMTGRQRMLTSGPSGTPAYMAPERLDGKEARIPGDVYGYCVTAWEALAEVLPDPFSGPPKDLKRAIPRPLRKALLQGMHRDPSQRGDTLLPILRALHSVQKRSKRKRSISIAGAVLAAGAGLGLAIRGGGTQSTTPSIESRAAKSAAVSVSTPDAKLETIAIGRTLGVGVRWGDSVSQVPGAGALRVHATWADLDVGSAWPDNRLHFSRSDPEHDLDGLFADVATLDKDVFAVLIGQPRWLTAGDLRPLVAGSSATDPSSYTAHAQFVFQFVSRYGGREVPAEQLSVAAGGSARTGLDRIAALEHWRTTPGRPTNFSPAEYAAFASADYDGHRGALGDRAGAKSADPELPFVMAALSGQSMRLENWTRGITDYLDGIRAWSERHRDGEFPADILNVHIFASTSVPYQSPEAARLEERIAELAAYRDRHLERTPLWVTAFGYDTHPSSHLAAPQGNELPGLVHAQWTVRSYLALLAGGAQRVFVDSLADIDTTATTQHTSGLTGRRVHLDQKPAWYSLATLRSALAEHQFVERIDLGTPGVHALVFSAQGGQTWAVWADLPQGAKDLEFSMPADLEIARTRALAIDDTGTRWQESPPAATAGMAGPMPTLFDVRPVQR